MDGSKFAGAGRLLAGLFALGLWTLQADNTSWQVPGAAVRVTVELTGKPSPTESGYFVHIPDGGVLPGRVPIPAVFAVTGSGANGLETNPTELESYLLWHNRASEAAIVFADPGPSVRKVVVYLSGGATARPWKPDSKLKPSAVLCTEPTPKADLRIAKELARFGPAGPTVHTVNKSGIPIAPLSIGGDESGHPKPASFYLLSHVITTDPGKTWIAPFTIDGDTLVLVNGEELKPVKRIDKWGGTGAWFDLKKGLNRIEVFQTAPGTGEYGSDRRSGGLMYLTWRTPHATNEELGGARSNKVPMTGTSRMETRVLKFQEIARSGDASVERIEALSGGPVASMHIRPRQVFWVNEESPLIVCDLEAITEGNPPDTTYIWDFAGKGTIQRQKASWAFLGLREHPIKLTAKSAKGTSQCVIPYFAYSTINTDLSSPTTREELRNALTEMVKAFPAAPDPIREWGPAFWNNVVRTLELGKGFDLLENLITQRRATLRQTISPAQLATLEDVYLDMLQQRNPKKALELVDTFGRESNGQRLEELFMRKFEIQMYYLDALADAETGLKRLAERASGEIKEWGTIRVGDAAFLGGDVNKATGCYTEVQNRAREARNRAGGTPLDKLVTEQLLPEGSRSAPPAEDEKGGRKRKRDNAPAEENQEVPPPSTPSLAPEPGPARGKWGVDALLDVNLSENVSTLIENGYYLEAKEALRSWERRFPLSKISGDYLIQEAKFHMAMQDWKRARSGLEAYCRSVDASSFLPEAARLLVQCAKEMKTPPAEIRKVIEAVKGNLQFHPVAKELEAYLASGK